MNIILTAGQRRVLGVLIEKSLATPEYYPMTLNAVLAACNQKNNRDPVVSYTEDDVGRVLYELMQMHLVKQADSAVGARANRFEHQVQEQLDWNRRHRAVMAELLLRGPQTVGELKTRSARMVPLPDLAAVASVLDELAQRDPPQVRLLPRQSGHSAPRYAHLLYPTTEAVEHEPEPTAPSVSPVRAAAAEAPSGSGLAERVARLEAEVADLRARLDSLAPRARLSASDS